MATIRRLISYFRHRPVAMMFGLICQILAAGFNVYTPMIAQQFIDYVADRIEAAQAIEIGYLIQKIGWYVLVSVVGAIFSYVSYIVLMYVANAISKRIRDEVYEHMQGLPVRYFDDKPAGKISARIVNDTEVIRSNFFGNVSIQILINLLFIIGVYVAIFYVDVHVGLVFLLIIPIIVAWQLFYTHKVKPINHRWREAVSDLNSHTAEIVQGVSIVQVFNREDTMDEDFQTVNNEWLSSRQDNLKLESTISWSLSELLKNITILVLISYIGGLYINDILGYSIGTVYVFINYITRLFDPIGNIVRQMTNFQQAMVAGSRVFELMDQPLEQESSDPLIVGRGEVRFNHVSFGYSDDKYVLRDIDFIAHEGETVALVGHTGSGKSSMINLLFRFYDPQEGTIEIDNQVIQTKHRESVRDQMGIVLQDPYLFTGTIASNVSMNDDNITDAMIEEALIKVGAGEMLTKFELGIHHPIQEKGQGLSSGERQLISFARTLVTNPKILILDEATSHIDTETEDVIQQAMAVLQEGRTTFIIAHRLSTIVHAQQILLLEAGEIKERGSHAELIAQRGRYYKMYQTQAQST